MVVNAHDLGSPSLQSADSCSVTVRCQRNLNCPQFKREPYEADIEMITAIGENVLQIRADDDDARVCSHTHTRARAKLYELGKQFKILMYSTSCLFVL